MIYALGDVDQALSGVGEDGGAGVEHEDRVAAGARRVLMNVISVLIELTLMSTQLKVKSVEQVQGMEAEWVCIWILMVLEVC